MNINDVKIRNLSNYEPYWIYKDSEKIHNPEFNDFTGGYILDVKQNKDKGVNYYTTELLKVFSNPKLEKINPIIICVPSREQGKIGDGLKRIIDTLCNVFNLDNFCGYLHRDYTIDKLALGGNRNIDIHLKSISVKNKNRFKNRNVIILDDVTTTGNSFLACSELLIKCDVKGILCIALGKTVNHR